MSDYKSKELERALEIAARALTDAQKLSKELGAENRQVTAEYSSTLDELTESTLRLKDYKGRWKRSHAEASSLEKQYGGALDALREANDTIHKLEQALARKNKELRFTPPQAAQWWRRFHPETRRKVYEDMGCTDDLIPVNSAKNSARAILEWVARSFKPSEAGEVQEEKEEVDIADLKARLDLTERACEDLRNERDTLKIELEGLNAKLDIIHGALTE